MDTVYVEEIMTALGLDTLKDRIPSKLSGGQQQRVLLARALCATGKLLLLDEPVSALDPVATADFYALIRKLNREDHIAVIMISHDIQAAVKQANRILHLDSPLRFFGTTAEYLQSDVGHAFCEA